jgi:hypothetical protein
MRRDVEVRPPTSKSNPLVRSVANTKKAFFVERLRVPNTLKLTGSNWTTRSELILLLDWTTSSSWAITLLRVAKISLKRAVRVGRERFWALPKRQAFYECQLRSVYCNFSFESAVLPVSRLYLRETSRGLIHGLVRLHCNTYLHRVRTINLGEIMLQEEERN